jgi:hypothetical protein
MRLCSATIGQDVCDSRLGYTHSCPSAHAVSHRPCCAVARRPGRQRPLKSGSGACLGCCLPGQKAPGYGARGVTFSGYLRCQEVYMGRRGEVGRKLISHSDKSFGYLRRGGPHCEFAPDDCECGGVDLPRIMCGDGCNLCCSVGASLKQSRTHRRGTFLGSAAICAGLCMRGRECAGLCRPCPQKHGELKLDTKYVTTVTTGFPFILHFMERT